jgi:hypothetical protein
MGVLGHGAGHVAAEVLPRLARDVRVRPGEPLAKRRGVRRVALRDLAHREDRGGRQRRRVLRQERAQVLRRDDRILMGPQDVLDVHERRDEIVRVPGVDVLDELQGVSEPLAPDPQAMEVGGR